ncbi:aldehyde dehydrogenase (NADP(+)) [Methylobacterium sp. NEAU K]|uniref:aldehyde dehydrogenase (NADP(+)) n=1 Tax=Methylobacterium sp. NEAU K TaxID=3064946 RepID=UPI002736FC59|nr:aldehyde dehydrogenase (NADP(+)) [Methylobacterium sp. NEAU K]MDP4005676.1 aldehyde dehydrogenase (NADP(+)) [Methylobacterium sp. NEAU K]
MSKQTNAYGEVRGAVLIGAGDAMTAETFRAVDPASGAALEPVFSSAGSDHVEAACALAEAAFPSFSETNPEARARFLDSVAEAVAELGAPLIERAMAETGLPRARLEGERARTIGQIRLFAALVRTGDWVQATIDPAQPKRVPLPRSDLRRRHVALGPVAVFGASNFPLAFSVAGGDTASALAAGCPVVVKGHPAHPGTGEMVARAVRAAVAACDLHAGVFSYLPGPSNALGTALVADPRIKAVGFTGSRGGGLALMRVAAGRAEPIPVYAEMSAVNPVLLLPGALRTRGTALAAGFVRSLTLGAGQFCTNPGLLIGIAGPELDAFAETAAAAIRESAPHAMLTADIRVRFERSVAEMAARPGVVTVAHGEATGPGGAPAILLRTAGARFLADPALTDEMFGPAAILVAAADAAEVARIVAALPGQLTATLHLDRADERLAAGLVPVLARKAGRILANGWPTGVEVAPAMVHGGPFPATSDGRTTSVGTLAIERFLRPVCYQDLPDALLPQPLRPDNPWHLTRRIDGTLSPAFGR